MKVLYDLDEFVEQYRSVVTKLDENSENLSAGFGTMNILYLNKNEGRLERVLVDLDMKAIDRIVRALGRTKQ